ncbi:hypothetical protein ARSEF4850_006399 [Beauveria asiatica]
MTTAATQRTQTDLLEKTFFGAFGKHPVGQSASRPVGQPALRRHSAINVILADSDFSHIVATLALAASGIWPVAAQNRIELLSKCSSSASTMRPVKYLIVPTPTPCAAATSGRCQVFPRGDCVRQSSTSTPTASASADRADGNNTAQVTGSVASLTASAGSSAKPTTALSGAAAIYLGAIAGAAVLLAGVLAAL